MRRTLVTPGSYAVSVKKMGTLEAILGTCVGVTLCDRVANIGGLIHLLLPEPTGMASSWQPEKYAATGLPLFIRSLCDAGASRERLEACMAGGALLEPLSTLDLDLDIGGRTSAVAERILHNEGISLARGETGGFFSCSLSLDLQTWQSRIEPAGALIPASADTELNMPSPDQLDQTIAKLRPIPQIALKILRMINDCECSLKEMAVEARKDQVLSGGILRLCNSALFGLRERVDSIDRALAMLGDKRFLRLAVSASLEGFFSDRGRGYSLCRGGLYYHALRTATITEMLADSFERVSPGAAYTAGLLHDIGKVVLDQYMAPVLPYFYRRTHVDRLELIKVERETLGIDHAQAGRNLAERWSLSPNLIDAISYHHEPECAIVDCALAHLVYLADLMTSRFLVGQELGSSGTSALALRLRKMGINPEQLTGIIDLIPSELFHGLRWESRDWESAKGK